jgi:hypothetical protein
MHIVVVLKFIVVVFLAAVLARAGRAVLARRRSEPDDDLEPARSSSTTWARRLVLLVTLAVAMGLVACQLGGYYFFLDPTGGRWTVYGHGWPLINQQDEPFQFTGDAELPVYLFALAADLLLALAVMVATVAVLDRLLAHGRAGRPGVEPRANCPPRRALWLDLGGLLAALSIVLVLDHKLATPVMLPSAEQVLLFASVSQEVWYTRVPCLAGLTAALFMAGVLTSRGLLKLIRLRDEGVI